MIEERGRVLSTEPGAVWVATIRSSTCGSCQAKAGCGQALLQKLGSGSAQGFVRALTEQQWQVGDEVLIGVPEDAVVRSALWMYLVPLAGLFGAALVTQWLGFSEPGVIFAAAAGLLLGFALVRWHDRHSQGDLSLQPQVIARAGASVAWETRAQEGY
ncbi:sigma-E factor negative regulatory protein RseC [Halopseudomonas sabulinigri]|uniref:Sigma-E factor negative regulatory protein RseC n=1 Tax=Halopseudomonas sabulinigri TaxID=472181 RepID=A0A1H1WZY8_9GAMM|nr:SoxR reducing system RseC family protein [Halopseudomonas sabulinigri]SDT02637.1 sigma-E factor negative regulatory protein RseC [Halopseudomonas sabulinigri]